MVLSGVTNVVPKLHIPSEMETFHYNAQLAQPAQCTAHTPLHIVCVALIINKRVTANNLNNKSHGNSEHHSSSVSHASSIAMYYLSPVEQANARTAIAAEGALILSGVTINYDNRAQPG